MPLIFILMKNKTQSKYLRIFNILKNEYNIKPKNIVIDFEMALINAFANFGNEVKISGCIFHYGQSIWK